ncbi:MAG TPA: tetratricopeptide repeat protein [Deltaproteobacteria bacterium]|nr:tetratricopeptide repeat protein [Deltaproteobacteria bacterium]
MNQKNKKIEQAENYLSQGRYNEAIELLHDLRKTLPDEESVLLMLAWAYYDSGNTGRAVESFRELFERELRRNIFTGFAYDELVRIYKQEKKYRQLAEICEKAVCAQAQDIGLLAELGNAYLRSGNPQKARVVYEKIVRLDEDNAFFYCCWGEALFACEMIKESEDAYERACQIEPEQSGNYYFKLAVLFQKAQKYDEAVRIINKCIAANPENALYYCSRGDCLIYLGKIQDALQEYEKALEHGRPGNAGAYFNRLGNLLMKEKHYFAAAAAFERAIEHEKIQTYYLGLASAYRAMGREDKFHGILSRLNDIKQN